jgi:G:T-mismatch repair DNA endonuclease (very short patch repair protein)
MADIFTKEQRSEVMRQVKSARNKSTELKLIAFLRQTALKVGAEVTNFSANLILLFPNKKQLFSLTVVFGTDTIAGTLALKTMRITGQKNGNET